MFRFISSCILLFLFTGLALGQRRSKLPARRLCVRSGSAIVLETKTRQCPCFLHGLFVVDGRTAALAAQFYALTPADYETWMNLSSPKGAPKSRIPLPGSNLLNVISSFASFGWRTGTIRITEPGEFKVIAIVASRSSNIRCIRADVELEEKPDTCPLRLAPPPLRAAFNSSRVSTFVVGGTMLDDATEFTEYNALISTNRGNCTGSLISGEWVLTAAHCRVNNLARVQIGGTTLGDGEAFGVSQVINHRDYVGPGFVFNAASSIINDIAVVRLSRPVRNAKFLALNSNTAGPDPGTIVRATGYGLVTTRATSNTLRMVDIAVLSTNECRNRFGMGGSIVASGIRPDVHVCVGRDTRCEEGGVCFGDSGGPIVARMPDGSLLQIGITSFGDTECGNENSADVFTRVSHYIDWIQRNTNNAATPVKWETVNNVASSGKYGTEDTAALPLWALVTIIVGGCVCLVGVALIVFVLMGRRQAVPDRGERPERTQQQMPHQEVASTNGNQYPPPGGDVEAAYPVTQASYAAPPVNDTQIPPPPPPRAPQQAPVPVAAEPTAPLPVYTTSAPPRPQSLRDDDKDRIEVGGLGPRPQQ